jgi:capsular exopolysaccharide synthesis family protein
MSQVRNLFERSLKQRYNLVPPSVEALSEEFAGVTSDPGEVSGNREIPTVTAHLQPNTRVIFHGDPHSPGADRFRFLRMRLRERWPVGKPRTLLVTSPLAHDGKSTITLNLATALCEHGKHRVLLLEADLHHACLAQKLELPSWPGLADCLQDSLNPVAAIRRVEPLGWYLLPAGVARGNPTDLLQTPTVAALMEALVPRFDWVLIDSPPVIPLTDALSLRQETSGSLLVVRAEITPDEAVENAIGLLGRQHVLGVVLNGVEGLERLYSKYGYYDKPAAKAGVGDPR